MGMVGVAEPVHRVRLSSYWLAETPVTNAQYAKFLAETPGYEEPSFWRDRRFCGEAQPVVGVRWDDANRFCAWLSQRPELVAAGVKAVLPSEAQWEFAARGTDGRRFPWGDQPADPTRAVFGRTDGTARVGSCPAGQGPFGHLDLAGNVVEWCVDGWDEKAYARRQGQDIVDPVEPPRSEARVLRGSWWGRDAVLAAAERLGFRSGHRLVSNGFRVAAVPASR